jgi:hypothetical protein
LTGVTLGLAHREALQKLLGDNKKARDFSREVIPEAIRSGMKGEWALAVMVTRGVAVQSRMMLLS